MGSSFNVSSLVALLYRYYPVNLYSTEPGYYESAQFQRLLATRKDAQEHRSGPWKKLLQKLQDALPDCAIEDWSVLWSDDNCWRVRVQLPGSLEVSGGREHRSVVLLASILAPVYVRYTSLHLRTAEDRFQQPRIFYEAVPETKRITDLMDSLAQQTLEVTRLPNEALFIPVPDIQCRNSMLGEAKLIDCLFTDDRW